MTNHHHQQGERVHGKNSRAEQTATRPPLQPTAATRQHMLPYTYPATTSAWQQHDAMHTQYDAFREPMSQEPDLPSASTCGKCS
jgi:hypothetical protein